MATRRGTVTVKSKPFHLWRELKEVAMFFQERDEVHRSLRRLVKRLDKAGIAYVVAGGMAVFAHQYRRTTDDLDILLTSPGLAAFQRLFVPKKYDRSPERSRRFVDRVNDVTVDVLLTGHFPGSGRPGPISFPNPSAVGEVINKVRFLDLATLIQLKLAARRHQDFADVVNLIRANELHEGFLEKLHSTLHNDYIECLEEKRREDEYIKRFG